MFRTLAFSSTVALGLSFGTLGLSTDAAFADDTVTQSGSFEGRSNHVTNGTISIVKTDSGYQAVLEDDFDFDGAPDPKLAFANGGKVDESTIFVLIRKNKGRQVYDIPASINPADFDGFFLWCQQYSVPLGYAALN